MKMIFLGGANEVGASCTLIEIEETRILVDAGIRQSVKQDTPLPDLDKIGKIDAFLLTHAHTDHTGALPGLISSLPACVKGYCTPATKPITRVLLEDSKNHLEPEEQEKSLFTPEAIDTALDYLDFMETVQWNTPVRICDGVTATWIRAGHILGAAMIYIQGKRESILMTGDVSVNDQKTIPGVSMSNLPKRVDVMVMESTYGNKCHTDRTEEEKRFVQDVAETIKAGGKVLIPVFAIGRSQEVSLILKHAMQRGEIHKFPVWVDGMVTKINSIYSRQCFADELLPSLKDEAERGEDIFYSDDIKPVPQDFNRDEVSSWEPCCIVASSGMLIGGRSSNYAKHLAGDPKNMIAVTGYQAEGTPGRALEDLAKVEESTERVWTLDNETSVLVKCQVPKRYSLSAHADGEQLTSLVKKVKQRKLFLVHGDDAAAREKLAKSIRENCPNVAVKLPENGCRYTVKKWSGIAEGRSLDHSRILAELYDFVLRAGLNGPFSARQLAEIWFGTAATTLIEVNFFLWSLSLDYQFFVRDCHLFYPRQPA